MSEILDIRAFVPAKDFGLSKRFYETLGFVTTYEDKGLAILKIGNYSFHLQDFYVKELADNFMLQLLVTGLDAWWERVDGAALERDFGTRPPIPPKLQSWGMRVGFLFDPSGVLWHVAEV